MRIEPASAAARTHPGRRTGRRLAFALALASGLASGCVSIRAARPAPQELREPGSVEVRVYETAADARRGELSSRRVQSELFAISPPGDEVSVHRSWAPSWGMSGLPAGAYRLRVTGWRDADGAYHAFAAPDDLRFHLASDDGVNLRVVLRSGVRAATYAGMFVAVVAGCAALGAAGIPCD